MKAVLFISYFLFCFSSNAQFSSECFDEAKQKIVKDAKEGVFGQKDSTGMIYITPEQRAGYFIGCKFPYAPLRSYDDKEINPINIKADLTIINYNYTYCQECLLQLDKLMAFKKESKKDIKIIVLFKEKKEDLKEIIEKYKDHLFIAADAENWMKAYNLGMGYPLNYILDKNKSIKYLISGGSYDDTDEFSKTLRAIK